MNFSTIVTIDIGEFTSLGEMFEKIAIGLGYKITDNIKYNKDKLSISPMLYEEIKEYADNNLLANAKLFMVVQCPKVDEYADLQRNDFVVHKGFVEYENN